MNIKRLKWLYPGMLIKRWISLTVFGILMISMGFVIVLSEKSSQNKAIAGVIMTMGILCVIYAVKKILKSLMTAVMPEPGSVSDMLVEKIYQKRILEKGPKIVVIGGGTGLSTLLTGLKQYTSNITAIVTVADDGGSSGRLREEFGVLPPGDIRNCLVALADSEDLLGALFQFRFKEGTGLHGHSFGNLFITALSKVTGDFAKAIKESSKVLAIRGNVFPATLQRVKLVARRKDGRETIGESHIRDEKGSPIDKIWLIPEDCKATRESVEAIKTAEAVILGPGSLYTSVMPNLLIDGIKKAVARTKARKIYICNVMSEPGETDEYSVSDHVQAILKHAYPMTIDFCVANVTRIPKDLYRKYEGEQKFPVKIDDNDERWLKQEKITLVRAPIASMKEFVRHDPEKLCSAIMNIVGEQKKR